MCCFHLTSGLHLFTVSCILSYVCMCVFCMYVREGCGREGEQLPCFIVHQYCCCLQSNLYPWAAISMQVLSWCHYQHCCSTSNSSSTRTQLWACMVSISFACISIHHLTLARIGECSEREKEGGMQHAYTHHEQCRPRISARCMYDRGGRGVNIKLFHSHTSSGRH